MLWLYIEEGREGFWDCTPDQVTLQESRSGPHNIPAGKLGSMTTSNRSRLLDWWGVYGSL